MSFFLSYQVVSFDAEMPIPPVVDVFVLLLLLFFLLFFDLLAFLSLSEFSCQP